VAHYPLIGVYYISISLYDQLYHCRREPGEDIRDFNDRFNTLVKKFPQSLEPPKDTILQSYMQTINDPYGSLIGKNNPTTLMEAQQRACQIDENMTSSHHHNDSFPQGTMQASQMIHIVHTNTSYQGSMCYQDISRNEERRVDVEADNHILKSIKEKGYHVILRNLCLSQGEN
jgi:hypothetical protein